MSLEMYIGSAARSTPDTLIWAPGSADRTRQVRSPKLVDQWFKVPTLSFILPPNNAGLSVLAPITSRVALWENGSILFYGRPISVQTDMGGNRTVVCESALGFLRDIYVWLTANFGANEISNPLSYLYNIILNERYYNPNIDVHSDFVYLGSGTEDASRTYATLPGKKEGRSPLSMVWDLAEAYPSALWMSYEIEDGAVVPLLNFAELSFLRNTTEAQDIRFGENLIDLQEKFDASRLFTQLRGYDTTNGVWFDYSVASHVAQNGIIQVGKDFTDINEAGQYTDPAFERTAAAEAYYAENAYMQRTLTVKALDRADLGQNVTRMRVGRYYRVYSPPHGINERVQCQKITRLLDQPGRSTYEFGSVTPTLTGRMLSELGALHTTPATDRPAENS